MASVPRQVNPIGDKPEEYDDTPKGGIFHRAEARGWRNHPTHPGQFECVPCSVPLYGEKARNRHVEWHRQQAKNDAEWMDVVEQLVEERDSYKAEVAELRTQQAEMRGEWNFLSELLRPGIQRLMAYEAAIRERE